MGNITLGQIASVLAFIAAFVSSMEFIVLRLNKILDNKLQPINNDIKEERISRLKSDLVQYMALAEQNLLIGKQKERAYEEFDEYTKAGFNSYIHAEWERLQKEGKI